MHTMYWSKNTLDLYFTLKKLGNSAMNNFYKLNFNLDRLRYLTKLIIIWYSILCIIMICHNKCLRMNSTYTNVSIYYLYWTFLKMIYIKFILTIFKNTYFVVEMKQSK